MIDSSTRGTEADASARPWLVAALGLFLIGAGLLVWRTPMFEAPDENSHAEYAGLVLARQRIPLVLGTAEQTGEPRWVQAALGHHPPLYYAVLASILRIGGARDLQVHVESTPKGSGTRFMHGIDELEPTRTVEWLRLLRGFSVLCGLISLLAIHGILRELVPSSPRVAALGIFVLATNGGWLRTHAVLDNGNLALTLTFVVLWILARAMRRGTLSNLTAVGLGLIAAAALWTKLTAIVCPGAIGLALLLGVRSRKPEAGDGVRSSAALEWRLALALVIAVGLWIPWILRNLDLYGEPLATAVHQQAYAASVLPEEVRWQHLLRGFPAGLYKTALGPIGWNGPLVPIWLQAGTWMLLALAALGFVRRSSRPRIEPRAAWMVLGVGVAALLLVVRFNSVFVQPQVRYALAATPVVALFIGSGLSAWIGGPSIGSGRRGAVSAVAAIGLGLWGGFLVVHQTSFSETIDGSRRRTIATIDLDVAPLDPHLPPPVISTGAGATPRIDWPSDGGPWSVALWVEGGPRFGGTFESLGLSVEPGSFDVPPVVWDYLESGDELSVCVRELASSGAAVAVAKSAVAEIRR